MSEDLTKHGGNSEAGYEARDMSPGAVYAFLVGLAIACGIVALVLWGVFRAMNTYDASHQPPQNPLLPATAADTRVVPPDAPNKFPQPRLEKNERLEINEFLLKQEQTLDSYGWVDQKSGVVRIPIERAMQLIAQRGLPTTPKVGAIPPAEASPNQAAPPANLAGQGSKRGKGKQ
jgi:hypothetical protein